MISKIDRLEDGVEDDRMNKDALADLIAKELEQACKRACRQIRSRESLSPPIELTAKIEGPNTPVVHIKIQIWESIS